MRPGLRKLPGTDPGLEQGGKFCNLGRVRRGLFMSLGLFRLPSESQASVGIRVPNLGKRNLGLYEFNTSKNVCLPGSR